MSKEKRERQRAARELKVQTEEAAAKRSRLRRRAITIALIVGLAVGAAFAYSAIFGDDDGDDVATDDVATDDVASDDVAGDDEPGAGDDASDESDEGEAEESAGVTTTLADPGQAVEPTCPADDGSSPREVNFAAPPPMCIDPSVTYVAQVETTRGDFEITLDSAAAPQTVNNFVFLARWQFYEDVGFHRIIPGFVVQGGDPVGPTPGQGGPGYRMGDDGDFDGELPDEEPYYLPMSVAMANSDSDPQTNGSQFFIVTSEDEGVLAPDFTRFGQVTAGEDVVRAIEASGTPGGEPAELTVIEAITITEAS